MKTSWLFIHESFSVHESSLFFTPLTDLFSAITVGIVTSACFSLTWQDLLRKPVRHRFVGPRWCRAGLQCGAVGQACYVIYLDNAKQVAKEVVYCNCNNCTNKCFFDSFWLNAHNGQGPLGMTEWLKGSIVARIIRFIRSGKYGIFISSVLILLMDKILHQLIW